MPSSHIIFRSSTSGPFTGPFITITGTASDTWYASSGAYPFPGPGTYYLVPSANIISDLKIWGAGGRDNNESNRDRTGGAGGFAGGRITFLSGQTYTVIVGGVGSVLTNFDGGGGGGFSGLFRTSTVSQATAVLMAGGGGGSMVDPNAGKGGAGGGLTGQDGTSWGAEIGRLGGGGGGTQSAGGSVYNASTATTGSALQGGQSGTGLGGTGGSPGGGGNGSNQDWGGAGGGGGYFGGGGGQALVTFEKGCGGGGSGRIDATYISSGVLTTGNYNVPGNNTDPYRGASGNANTAGKVVLIPV